MEITYNDINMPSMEDKGVRPKEQRGQGNTSGGHRTRTRTDIKHLSTQVSRRDEAIRHLSVSLYDILDLVGASAELRQIRHDCAMSEEIICTFALLIKGTITLDLQRDSRFCSLYIVGSSCEGSTTQGLNSDTDILICYDKIPVIDKISDARDRPFFLMIRGEHTQPGYVKLQRVYNGQSQTVYMREFDRDMGESDVEGRICLKHVSQLGKSKGVDERNGPADTSTEESTDTVIGFKCSKIPEFSREWIGRKRQYKWPSKRMIDTMTNMGCFVVGVGHPTSIEKNIEWRLSFSLQEREMMFSMNLVQHKCYIVLKMIKKDLIEPVVGKSISSYHLKTCMFYTMETTKSKIWKRGNMVQCVLLCLSVLLNWVYKGYCPNYFIKEENMFDRDLHRTHRLSLIRQINVLLSSGFGFLFTIKLDQIGALLKYKSTCNVAIESELNKTIQAVQKIKVLDSVLVFSSNLCVAANRNTSAIYFINMILTYLTQSKSIWDHTEQQTQTAFVYILPFVHLRLAQSLASLAFNTNNEHTKNVLLQGSGYHLRQGGNCYLRSSRFLETTVLYKLKLYERCIDILDQLEFKLNQEPLSICCCYFKRKYYNDRQLRQLSALSVPSIMSS